jgi:hypothetical protein
VAAEMQTRLLIHDVLYRTFHQKTASNEKICSPLAENKSAMATRVKADNPKIMHWVMFVKVALGTVKEPERVRIELSYPKVTAKAA